MKTTITATLAALLLASTAGAALAQDQERHHRGDGGDRPQQLQDNERRDMTGGEDRRGQRRSEFQADQAPPERARPDEPRAAPVAREAPQAPAAVQAPEPRQPRAQFRGDGGQGLANGRDHGRETPDANRDRGGARDGDRLSPVG